MCAPMFLTQVAILLKSGFLGNADRRISTWPFFPFLSVEGRFIGFLIRFALLRGTLLDMYYVQYVLRTVT